MDLARPIEASDPLLAHFDSDEVVRPSGVVGRFLAIAGLVLWWTPFFGLVLNAIGLCVNRPSDGLARKISAGGLVIGGLVAAVVGIGLALGL